MNWIHNLLSEFSSDSPSIVRVLALAAMAEYLVLAAIDTWRSGHFQMQDFGIGMGAVILAVGGALKLGEKSEPQEPRP